MKDLGLAQGELTQMKELDYMYGGKTTSEELDEIREEEDAAAIDPYLKKKTRFIKPQQFRTITLGPEDLLKND